MLTLKVKSRVIKKIVKYEQNIKKQQQQITVVKDKLEALKKNVWKEDKVLCENKSAKAAYICTTHQNKICRHKHPHKRIHIHTYRQTNNQT